MLLDSNRFARFNEPLLCKNRPILFLDRDGTINHDDGYTYRTEDLRLIDGVAEAISRTNSYLIPVVIITNQSGVGRGYYSWDDFQAFQLALDMELDKFSARVDGVLACSNLPFEHDTFCWRKPLPGMINFACDQMRANKAKAWMVGDRQTDIIAAEAAGLCGAIKVGAGDYLPVCTKEFRSYHASSSASAINQATDQILQS